VSGRFKLSHWEKTNGSLKVNSILSPVPDWIYFHPLYHPASIEGLSGWQIAGLLPSGPKVISSASNRLFAIGGYRSGTQRDNYSTPGKVFPNIWPDRHSKSQSLKWTPRTPLAGISQKEPAIGDGCQSREVTLRKVSRFAGALCVAIHTRMGELFEIHSTKHRADLRAPPTARGRTF
jgi:hypothetical protein